MDELRQTLLLCFKLHDSRVSVVSSTAAATLRQAVMLVFDRISPDNLQDAHDLFSDLCVLTQTIASLWSSIPTRLIKLSSLQKTFGLELIESVLNGYAEGIKKVRLGI
jgi:hypothetical protein